MPLDHLLFVYLVSILIVLLPAFGFAKLFAKAGVPTWKAYVPFYNTWVMQDLAKRPKHWVFWQLIPVVGWFISPGIFIEFSKLFGRYGFLDHAAASLLAPFYFTWLGMKKDVRYIGPDRVRMYKKPAWREWVDAAVFAIVAATLIRIFIFEAYTIPSGSMEKTLLINDFLFVSKFSYGPRIPNTPLAIPFVHNYIPGTSRKSYSEAISLPYMRWFSSPVKRGDVVVFNFPAGDTVINRPEFQSGQPYYDVIRFLGAGNPNLGRERLLARSDEFPLAIHPPDKADNYIKRCVAVAGDSVEVRGNVVFVNGQQEANPPQSMMSYLVVTNGQILDPQIMEDDFGISMDKGEVKQGAGQNTYEITMTVASKEKLQASGFVRSITVNPNFNGGEGAVFPYDTDSAHQKWSRDNFGPVWVPKKGATIPINASTYPIYERAIRVYEGNEFISSNGQFLLNGKPINSYTFKMDYYWMMGDNRQGSQDSRYWGFVPEDRIVGKAWLIWFSYENGPRWNRLFRTVK